VQQLLFALFSLIKTFDFDLILGLFLTFCCPNTLILKFEFDLILGSFLSFWGPNGLVWGVRVGSTTVLGSTHVVEQLSFSMLP